jgi:hypothetical protein
MMEKEKKKEEEKKKKKPPLNHVIPPLHDLREADEDNSNIQDVQ